MRCNQVSIHIERFGEYVPKKYPSDVQLIHVYCDDFKSIYAALSKAYAMAINELNAYEAIGVRTDVYTNEFSREDYRKMNGVLPSEKTRFEQDVNLEYYDTRLALLRDYAWVYEHGDEILKVLKSCAFKEDIAPALKEKFSLNDVQVRKLLQIRFDMLPKAEYDKIRAEIEELTRKKEQAPKPSTPEDNIRRWKKEIRETEQEIAKIEAYFTVAEHYADILKLMSQAETFNEYAAAMEEAYDFSYEQARAIRYMCVDDFSKGKRKEKEQRMQYLLEERSRYQKWIDEEKGKNELSQAQ